jgi:hypothetical protein
MKEQETRFGGRIILSSETREKILHRCEILKYLGDDSICYGYWQETDEELIKHYGWVLDKEHNDIDNYIKTWNQI